MTSNSNRVEQILRGIVAPRVKQGTLSCLDAGLLSLMLAEDAPVTFLELQSISNVSKPTLIEHIRKLRSQGLLATFKDAKAYTYSVPDELRNLTGTVHIENTNSICDLIIEDLVLVTGKPFQKKSRTTRKVIKDRLKEGYTLDDFKKVHRNKMADWGDDKQWSKYLRPSTLYRASKFEGYLLEKSAKPKASVDMSEEQILAKYRKKLKEIKNLLEKGVIDESKAAVYKAEAKRSFKHLLDKARGEA